LPKQPPSPLPLKEITKRLQIQGFSRTQRPDDLLVFSRTVPAFFPYSHDRRIAYPVPPYDEDMPLPVEVIENILLHLFLSSDEEEAFWNSTADQLHLDLSGNGNPTPSQD
jgi:hypothetical protein